MLGILAILLLAIYVFTKQRNGGPIDETNLKSIHLRTDTIPDIIDRVEWSLLRENRVDHLTRYLMWGLWVTFLGSFVIGGKLPSAGVFLRNWIVISVVLLSLHGYYYWHSDKFSSFTSLSAIEELRKKLRVNKGDVDKLDAYDTSTKVGAAGALWTFTHTDYALGTRHPDST